MNNITVYINAFITKFLLFAPLMGIIMPIFSSNSMQNAIAAGFFAAAASFLTADLIIYPKYGNIPAILADVTITVMVLWNMSMGYISWIGLVIIIVILVFGEWYYHIYLRRTVFTQKK